MEAAQTHRRFSIAVQIYLWAFFAFLGFMPIFIAKAVSDRVFLPPIYWIAACLWPLSIAISFFYAQRQCSSDRMNFRDGLLWVTSSMMTGWMYQSFFTVSAGLAGAYVTGVFAAFAGDIRRDPSYARRKWLQIVSFFYRHRMRR